MRSSKWLVFIRSRLAGFDRSLTKWAIWPTEDDRNGGLKKTVASINRQQMKNRKRDGQKSKSARSDAGGHFHPLPAFAPVYPAMLVVKVVLLPAPPAALEPSQSPP
jgi:hypothetical protein